MSLGPHAVFIIASYLAGALILGALVVWTWWDYKTQRQALARMDKGSSSPQDRLTS